MTELSRKHKREWRQQWRHNNDVIWVDLTLLEDTYEGNDTLIMIKREIYTTKFVLRIWFPMNDSKHQTNKIIASRKTESQSSRRSREDLSEDWSLCHLIYIYFRTKQLSEHYFTVQLCSTYFPLKLLTSFPPKMKHLMFKRKFSNSDYGHDDLKNESLPRRDRSKKFSYLIHHQTQR